MHGCVLGVDRVHDLQSRGEKTVLLLPVEGQAQLLELDDRVEVPAEGEVVADRADLRDVDVRIPAHEE